MSISDKPINEEDGGSVVINSSTSAPTIASKIQKTKATKDNDHRTWVK